MSSAALAPDPPGLPTIEAVIIMAVTAISERIAASLVVVARRRGLRFQAEHRRHALPSQSTAAGKGDAHARVALASRRKRS
jgi:hypothetical protein